MKKLLNKILSLTFIFIIIINLIGCSNELSNFLTQSKNLNLKSNKKNKNKDSIIFNNANLKPNFMFSDDEKYFKNYMVLKEEFFLLNRYKFINASSINDFLVKNNQFILYDKAIQSLLIFNIYGVLENTVKLNFGSESRILAPTNMILDEKGNIIISCSILGRLYKFSINGILLNVFDITENDSPYIKQKYVTKLFSNSKYLVFFELNSKKVFVYENGSNQKLFDFKFEPLSDQTKLYFSPQNDIFIVDNNSSTIVQLVPNLKEKESTFKYYQKNYTGNKILKDSIGQTFILKNDENIIEKFDINGNLIATYGTSTKSKTNIDILDSIIPIDFAIGGDDSLYILDRKNYKVYVYSSSGVFSFTFGSYGKGREQFLDPIKIVVDKLNRIIVCDNKKNQALVFNLKGEFVESYGNILGTNTIDYGFYADLNDKIHIFDYYANNHYVLNYNFNFLKVLNDIFLAKTSYPQNLITISSAANFYFYNQINQKMYELLPNARLSRIDIPLEISSIKVEPKKYFLKFIAIDNENNILGLCKNEPYILKLNSTGKLIQKIKLPKNANEYSTISVDRFKNFYLTSQTDGKIYKFDMSGNLINTFEILSTTSKKNQFINLIFINPTNAIMQNVIDNTIFVLKTTDILKFETQYDISFEFKDKKYLILDIECENDNIYIMCNVNDNLLILKYKLVDYFKEGRELFAQGLYQEALVMFEKHKRITDDPGPNALYYTAKCLRNLSKNYEAAIIEAEITKKYPNSHAAERLR